MSAMLWRVLIAVICVVLVLALIPPVFHLIGFGLNGDLWLIMRICMAGIAVLYILRGSPPFPTA